MLNSVWKSRRLVIALIAWFLFTNFQSATSATDNQTVSLSSLDLAAMSQLMND